MVSRYVELTIIDWKVLVQQAICFCPGSLEPSGGGVRIGNARKDSTKTFEALWILSAVVH